MVVVPRPIWLNCYSQLPLMTVNISNSHGQYNWESTTFYTRSSAIPERPRDASCQLKSCQLQRNSAETTCTKSIEQIKIIKLEGYSGTVCNKHVHSTVTRSSRFHCPIGVINEPTTDRVVDITNNRRLDVAKFFKVHNVEFAHVTLTTPT